MGFFRKHAYVVFVLMWLLMVVGTYWATHGYISERFSSISGSWIFLIACVSLLLLAYILYNLFGREKEAIDFHLRPITVFFSLLLVSYLIYIVQYYDILGYFTSFFGNIGRPASEAGSLAIQQLSGGLTQTVPSFFSVSLAFLTKLFTGALALIVTLISALGLGSWAMPIFKGKVNGQERLFLQVAVGFASLMFVLFFLGWGGMLSTVTVWGLLLVGVVLSLLFSRRDFYLAVFKKHPIRWEQKDLYIQSILYTLFALIIAVVIVHVLRPIPIGWDDLSLYMNVPSLLYDYGALISGQGVYNWGLIMSLGFFLFQEPYIAMLLSFLGGLLAVWGVYVLTKRFVHEKHSIVPLFMTVLFASMPLVLFQLGEDMKIDLALTFVGGACFLMSILWYQEDDLRTKKFSLLLGLLLGILLGIKFTALIFVFFIYLLLFLFWRGWRSGLALILLFSAVLFLGNIIAYGGISLSPQIRMIIAAVLGIIGLGMILVEVVISKKKDRTQLATILCSLIGVIISFSPWLVFHYTSLCDAQGCEVHSLEGLMYGKKHTPIVKSVDLSKVAVITTVATSSVESDLVPESEVIDEATTTTEEAKKLQETLKEQGGGTYEELQRYIGFDRGILTYATLPFDSSFNTHEKGDYVTLSWIVLALLPFFFLYVLQNYLRLSKIGYMLLFSLSVLLLVGGYFASTNQIVIWGNQPLITLLITSIFYLFPIVFFIFASKENLEKEQYRLLRYIVIASSLYWFAWAYLANGVIWYGILGFLPMFLLITQYLSWERKSNSHVYSLLLVVCTVFWFVPMFLYKFSNTQVTVPILTEGRQSSKTVATIDSTTFTAYKAGLIEGEKVLSVMNKPYAEAARLINEESDDAYVYRIGTFLPYFIRKNDSRVNSDNQLDTFTTLYLPHQNKKAVVDALKNGGFEFIVFDTYTDTIDRTKEQTLKQKADHFREFVSNNPYIVEVIDAPGIRMWRIL